MRYLLLALSLTTTAQAQSISVSPGSMKAWGTTLAMFTASMEYKGAEVHYFTPITKVLWDGKHPTQDTFAVSYKNGIDELKVGIMYTLKNFPIEPGSKLNFLVEIGYDFDIIGVYYRHISNGFGIRNDVNPGVDHILIRFNL